MNKKPNGFDNLIGPVFKMGDNVRSTEKMRHTLGSHYADSEFRIIGYGEHSTHKVYMAEVVESVWWEVGMNVPLTGEYYECTKGEYNETEWV